jgi:hypothetical protein
MHYIDLLKKCNYQHLIYIIVVSDPWFGDRNVAAELALQKE